MDKTLKTHSLHWLPQLNWILFGSSLLAAVVAFVVEGHEYLLGSVLLAISTLVICTWCLTQKPSLNWSVAIVCVAMVALGWTSGDPESALFQLVLMSAVVGFSVHELRPSLALLLFLVLTPPFGNLLAHEDRSWGWWNWSMGVLIIWSFGRVILLLEQTLLELTDARSKLVDSAAREERLPISRDVHDMVGHSLTAILLNIRAASQALASDSNDYEEAKSALTDAERIGVAGIADVRAMWIGLRQEPSENNTELRADESLTSIPDGEAVLQLLSEHEQIKVTTKGDVATLTGPTALTLYRILQECITNILKYASVGSASITLNVNQDDVELLSNNNLSAGSTSPVPLSEKTIGLISMRERVTSLGGTFFAGVENDQWRIACRIPRNG